MVNVQAVTPSPGRGHEILHAAIAQEMACAIPQSGPELPEAGDSSVSDLDDTQLARHDAHVTGQLSRIVDQTQVVGTRPQRFTLAYASSDTCLGFDNQSHGLDSERACHVLRYPELHAGNGRPVIGSALSNPHRSSMRTGIRIVERSHSRHADSQPRHFQKAILLSSSRTTSLLRMGIAKATLAPLIDAAPIQRWVECTHYFSVFTGLLDQFWQVEKLFSSDPFETRMSLLQLREEHKEDIVAVGNPAFDTRVSSRQPQSAILICTRPNKPNVGKSRQVLQTIPSAAY